MKTPSLNAVTGQKPREIAARVLQQRDHQRDFTENLLEAALAAAHLSPADRGLCQELVHGVVRWQAALDFLIAQKTAPGRNQKPALQNLLRLGLYQIFWLDRIPDHAAVHETVEQAKQNGFGPQAGFVNAVLRGCLREFDTTKNLLAELKKTRPHIGFSQPEWLVTRWQKRWGAGKTAQLLEWNNTPPKTFARINPLKFFHKGDRENFDERTVENAGDLLALWRDENVDYDFVRGDWFEDNLVFELKSHPPLARLRSFQRGFFYVQDPSTLLAVRELDPQPGGTVLDLCAAPGGKTTYLAQLTRNEGKIFAHDSAPERLKLVGENCERLGVTCVRTISTFDLRPSTFDRVLIDAPCSNTGVMRRRVDLRWRIRAEEIGRLRAAQLGLLKRAAPLLKSGGTLVYSTCSLEPEENSEVIEEFLREQSELKLKHIRELLPFVEGFDGAFVARLVKT